MNTDSKAATTAASTSGVPVVAGHGAGEHVAKVQVNHFLSLVLAPVQALEHLGWNIIARAAQSPD